MSEREQSSALAFGSFQTSSLDSANRFMAFGSQVESLVAGDTNGRSDIFVADLTQVFDQDHDTLDDRWETFSASTPRAALALPGQPAIRTATASPTRTSRRPAPIRAGCSGAISPKADRIVLPDQHRRRQSQSRRRCGDTDLRSSGRRAPTHAPPGAGEPAPHRVCRERGRTPVRGLLDHRRKHGAPRRRSDDVVGHPERARAFRYGAHSEAAVGGPATEWYLAEGSTVLDFQLFYQLQNPQNSAVDATVRYLRPDGAPIVRTYPLAAHSRTTIQVNAVDPALASSDVSGAISATGPIIVERAMYANRGGQVFALGTASRGVTAPATSWFLAEGATGTFFDTYVQIANPSATSAQIEARFAKPDGTSVVRTYTVAANSRFSIFVDAVPGLEATSVATTITSTNATPVIVERAMYWPGGFFEYYEGHSSPGVTAPGLRWALAEGETGGSRLAQTFVMIANTASTAGRARLLPLGEGAGGQPSRSSFRRTAGPPFRSTRLAA